jgi:type I restriction enzyme, S subunit
MSCEGWADVLLGDACTKIGSGATPRGGGDVYLAQGPYALIRSQNVYNDGFHRDGLAYIGDKHATELRNVEVRRGDVLLNITGDSVARCCQVDDSVLPARVNQHVAIVRPDPKKLNARFLRYSLVSPSMQAKMLSWAGAGATRNALTKGMIESFEVPAPKDVREQSAIGTVLGTLDDKIALNRRMSETLEGVARELFRSWFVDFDPVRARVAYRNTLPKRIADLFPDSFQDSELGDIPRGWGVRSVYDCATFVNGLVFRTGSFSQGKLGLPVIKIGELKGGITSQTKFTTDEFATKYRVCSGDVLFSWSGSPETSIDTFLWTDIDGWLNQHIFKVQFRAPNQKLFVFYLLRFLKPVFIEIARNKQTTGLGHVTAEDMKRLRICWPSDDVLLAFERTAEPLFNKAYSNGKVSRSLTELRDTLLPKLISGELRLADAERIVGGLV